MYIKIAVEDGLSNVTQALHAAGFQTTALEGQKLHNVQALVVAASGTDLLGQEANLRIPVISAAGRTAEEVVEILRDRLQ